MASRRDKDRDDKPFRHIVRDRILIEMLRSAKSGKPGDWKVLITDAFTLRVISSACKMADVTEEDISLIEDLSKRRQPQPSMEALYFIQPMKASVSLFLNDMQGRSPLYKRAHVYFSRPVNPDSLQPIKEDPQLRSRIAACKEMNLEILTVDIQGFVTDHPDALLSLYGSEISAREYERVIDEVAGRLATVFASLKEFPAVRYKAAKATASAAGSPQRMREMVPTKLAAALWDRLVKYKQTLADYPQTDTCDLLIVDRSVDPIAPVIHDWSYGGMVFDLLPVDGNKFEYETEDKNGNPEKKTVLLDEHDSVWLEMRDLFIAEAYLKVKEIFEQISAKTSAREGEMSGRELQTLVQNLSLYAEQKDKVALHMKISSSLSKQQTAEGLFDIGRLEQGFVFGDSAATYKELSALIKDKEDMSDSNKIRLLMVYAATHPEKLDPQKLSFWTQLAGLDDKSAKAVTNLEFLGVPLNQAPSARASTAITLSFGGRKSKAGVRKERKTSEEAYELSRFYPAIQDVLEDLHSKKLSLEDYPYVQEPTGGAQSASSGPSSGQFKLATSSSAASSNSSSVAASPASSGRSVGSSARAHLSVRKKPQRVESGEGSASGANPTSFGSGSSLASWALRGGKAEGGSISSGGSASGSLGFGGSRSDTGVKGRRLVIFIVGGMTRSEIRVAHLLSKELNREVLIGSTSLDTPTEFLEKVKKMRKR